VDKILGLYTVFKRIILIKPTILSTRRKDFPVVWGTSLDII
jgi:hypothetical protein